MKNPFYSILRHYGKIISSKDHETTEGHFIKFTTYEYEDVYYVVVMFDGCEILLAEKDDIAEMLRT